MKLKLGWLEWIGIVCIAGIITTLAIIETSNNSYVEPHQNFTYVNDSSHLVITNYIVYASSRNFDGRMADIFISAIPLETCEGKDTLPLGVVFEEDFMLQVPKKSQRKYNIDSLEMTMMVIVRNPTKW